jgi:hypothetical protein
MPGLVPGIHVLLTCGEEDVDGRVKPGHGERGETSYAEVPASIASRADFVYSFRAVLVSGASSTKCI